MEFKLKFAALFLILSLQVRADVDFGSSSSAQCFYFPGYIESTFRIVDELYKNGCDQNLPEAEYCECLMKKSGNKLVEEYSLKVNKESPELIQQAKEARTRQIMAVYNQINVGAAAQLEVLGITDVQKNTAGCPAEQLSGHINKALNNHFTSQAKANGGSAEIIQKNLFQAAKACSNVGNTILKTTVPGAYAPLEAGQKALNLHETERTPPCPTYEELMESEKLAEHIKKEEIETQKKTEKILKMYNEKAVAQMDQKLRTIPENYCVTYQEYLAQKQLPTPGFMDAVAKAANPADLLKAPELIRGQSELDRMNFLKNNPVLAKIAASEAGRAKLGQELQKFAKQTVNSPTQDKMKGYFNFMKNEVAAILKSTENAGFDGAMCVELGKNLGAVEVGTIYPKQELSHMSNSGMAVFQNVQACYYKSKEKENGLNLELTLAQNPLLSVYGSQEDDGFDSKGYEKFNNENCIGFDDKQATYIESKCKGNVKCIASLKGKLSDVDSKDSKRLRDSYFQERDQDNNKAHKDDYFSMLRGVTKEMKIAQPASRRSRKRMANYAEGTSLSKKVKEAISRASEMAHQTAMIATKGEEKKYVQSVLDNQSAIAAAATSTVPFSTASTEQKIAETPVVDPTWVNESEAPFSMPQFNSDNLSQGASAFLPKNYESLPPEKKVKAVQDVEDSLNKFEVTKLDQVKDLKDEIQDLREELADAKTSAKEEVTQQVAKAPQNNKIPLPSSGVSGAIPSNNPVYLPSSFATGGSMGAFGRAQNQAAALNAGSRSDLTKSNSDRDNALLSSKYAGAQKEALRGPASVEGLVVVSSEALSAIPKGVGFSNPLTVTDGQLDQFKGSAEALNKELQTRIKELGLKPGQNKMVEIRSKDSDKKMYLHAVWKDNSWVFHPFNRNVHAEIARTHTLKSLSETLQ